MCASSRQCQTSGKILRPWSTLSSLCLTILGWHSHLTPPQEIKDGSAIRGLLPGRVPWESEQHPSAPNLLSVKFKRKLTQNFISCLFLKAVVACQDDDGMDLVVGRAVFKVRNTSSHINSNQRSEITLHLKFWVHAEFQGGMHPGKLNPTHSSLYVSYGGEEVPMQEYEILIQVHIVGIPSKHQLQTSTKRDVILLQFAMLVRETENRFMPMPKQWRKQLLNLESLKHLLVVKRRDATIFTGWRRRMGRCLLPLWRFFYFCCFLHYLTFCNCPSLPLAVLEFLLLSPLRAGFVEFSSFINFQIGYESNGDPLFVARGRVVKDSYDDNSSMSVGKMNPRYGLAYLPYGGKVQLIWCHKNSATLFQEVEVAEYEVLCLKPICDLC